MRANVTVTLLFADAAKRKQEKQGFFERLLKTNAAQH
jgi:hypothetical protein